MTFVWIVVLALAGLLLYVRLAPTDGALVNQEVTATQDEDGEGHAVRVLADPQGDLFKRVDGVMRGLPRTAPVAGSLEEGRITYVTRSKWIGFPDYTTIEHRDGQLRMFARLRFGKSDFGVNRARLAQVKAALVA